MIFVGLGSNMGERLNYLTEGIRGLRKNQVFPVRLSTVYETPAWGGKASLPFLNAVAEVRFSGTPIELLHILLKVEASCGRVRTEKWGNRTLDLDLLSWGNLVLESPELRLPHPFLQERAFVLGPWQELSPNYALPGLGKTVREAWLTLPETERNNLQRHPDRMDE